MHPKFKYIPLTTGSSIQPTKAASTGQRGQGFKPLPDRSAARLAQRGVLTGTASGVVVVDLDPRNFEPGDNLTGVIHRLGLDAVETYTVETPRGGRHFYFTAPEDVLETTSIANAFGPGVDFKGDRGYVAAAGAVRDGLGGYTPTYPDVEVEAAALPRALVEILRAKVKDRLERRAAAYSARANVPAKVPDPEPCCRSLARETVGAVLEAMDELAGLREGERASFEDVLPGTEPIGWDDGFWKLAAKLVEVAEWPYTRYSMERAQADFLEHCPDDGIDPEHKWLNGYTNAGTFWAGEQHRLTEHTASVLDKVSLLPKDPAASPESAAERPGASGGAPVPLLDLAGLLDPNRPPREWFLEDVVPIGDSCSIVAPGGVGKSLLVLAWSLAAVRGETSFINRSLSFASDRRIMYLDMENSEDDWADRLRDLGVTQEEAAALVGRRFFPVSLPVLRGLDTAIGAAQLIEILDYYGIGAGDVLVLDSMQRVTEGPENDNDTIRNLYNFTSAELKRRGITVIRTDNTGKEVERGARGSSGKRDDVGYSWTLEPIGDETFALTSSKRRSAGSSDQIRFMRQTVDGRLQFTPVIESVEPIGDDFEKMLEFKEAVIEVLKNVHQGAIAEGTSSKLTQTRLLSEARKSVPVKNEKGRLWIGELAASGEIVATGGDEMVNDKTGKITVSTKYYEWVGVPDDASNDEEGAY